MHPSRWVTQNFGGSELVLSHAKELWRNFINDFLGSYRNLSGIWPLPFPRNSCVPVEREEFLGIPLPLPKEIPPSYYILANMTQATTAEPWEESAWENHAEPLSIHWLSRAAKRPYCRRICWAQRALQLFKLRVQQHGWLACPARGWNKVSCVIGAFVVTLTWRADNIRVFEFFDLIWFESRPVHGERLDGEASLEPWQEWVGLGVGMGNQWMETTWVDIACN